MIQQKLVLSYIRRVDGFLNIQNFAGPLRESLTSPPLPSLLRRRKFVLMVPSTFTPPTSDHTTGLYKSFSSGTIYTSKGTASLIVELMGVNQERVVALEMNKPHMVAGFELTLIDANHCPGAVMQVTSSTKLYGPASA